MTEHSRPTQWIIVTGHSRGVGQRLVSKLLAQTDYGVIGISRSVNEQTEEWQRDYTDKFKHISYDLNDVEGIKQLFLKEIAHIGPIYGLVNNSAMAYDDIASNLNITKLQNMYNVNVFAAMQLVKYTLRNMLLHHTQGSIVNISSISAHTGYKGLSMYASSKGAIEAFSKNIAREWGSRGIRSNCVVPGFMETAMSDTLTEDQKTRIYKRTSLKKETNIDSVCDSIIFLLSSSASSITGSVIHVDNGTI